MRLQVAAYLFFAPRPSAFIYRIGFRHADHRAVFLRERPSRILLEFRFFAYPLKPPDALKRIVPEYLLPDLMDFVPSSKRPVSADIEQILLAIHSSGDSAHYIIPLDDSGLDSVFEQFVARG